MKWQGGVQYDWHRTIKPMDAHGPLKPPLRLRAEVWFRKNVLRQNVKLVYFHRIGCWVLIRTHLEFYKLNTNPPESEDVI